MIGGSGGRVVGGSGSRVVGAWLDARELPAGLAERLRGALCAVDRGYERAPDATVIGRMVLVGLMRQRWGWDWRETVSAIRYSENGKPYFGKMGVDFSISHSGGRIAVGISEQGPIGLDIQTAGEMKTGFARHFLHPAEAGRYAEIDGEEERRDFLTRCWSRKEAVLKCSGEGLLKRRWTGMDVGGEWVGRMRVVSGRLGADLVCSLAFFKQPIN